MLFKQNVSEKSSTSRHSFVSRISNKIVLEQSGRQEISSIVTYRQLVLFGKIAALPSTNVRKQCVFSGQTLRPRIAEQPQRRGRPKNSWGSQRCTNLQPLWSGVLTLMKALLSNLKQWKILAQSFCFAQRQ